MSVATDRPAIILITCDELRADALSCYGGRAVETPHLDRLAHEGVRFTRAYTASPWCLPSRASIITGLYPHNHRAYSNFRDCRLEPERPNLYNVLRGAGYRTAHAGKCHYAPVPYGETKADRTLPYEAFHDYYGSLGIDDLDLQDDKQVSVWFRDDYARELDEAGHLAAYRAAVWDRSASKVFDFPAPAEWHPDAWVGRKAVERIRGHAADQPLFLWASFSGPHFPFDAPAEYHARVRDEHVGTGVYREGEFDDPRRIHHTSYHGGGGIEGAGSAPERACKNYSDDYWQRLRRTYFANVALIDDQVGEVLRAVEEQFGDNALVLFTTDHGEMLGNHRLWGKNNCAYEDVWNVPLLARYPAASPPAAAAGTEQPVPGAALHGTSVDSRVMLTDLAPTCLRAAGVEGAMPTDGLPLEEQATRGGRAFVFAEGEQFLVVGDGHTTYVTAHRRGEALRELFDLDADPHQFENMIDRPEYAARRLRLHEAAEQLFTGALLA
ncbi:MAG: Choline-sulfatase [uncultured Chloroflexi bacterium]|uniref:Choline-sulfatase n=1 Tax=uncultured Chloroflexota bacterium TaxID=166587 RepID=A0A6J4HVC2_9CHLR|nr:MAG: Choline-sulfatase [uncultured Chloroflexota bacterium]